MGRAARSCLIAAVTLASASPAGAHGDVREAIAVLEALIEKFPRDAVLYAKRGELYRQRMEWEAAIRDFTRAWELKPDSDTALAGRGLALLGAGNPEAAAEAFERAVELSPENLVARLGRARAQSRRGNWAAAAADLEFILARTTHPQPDYYLERASALEKMEGPNVAAALACLDEGMRRIGPAATLQLAAIELEKKLRRFDAALARVDALAGAAERKERWLAQRGQILEAAGRAGEAREAYERAAAALEQLPDYRRRNRAVKDLEREISAARARLQNRATGGTER